MTCNRNCDCVGECKAGNDKPTTPTPGDLSARLPKLPEPAIELPAPRYFAFSAEQMLTFRDEGIHAALSALPAGGEPVGEIIDSNEHPHYAEVRWNNRFGEPPDVGTKLYTTPQPSAAEDDLEASALAWMGATAESLQVASRGDGILTLAGALTGWINSARTDAAVGAQGEDDDRATIGEAVKMLRADGFTRMADAIIRRLAAPAAGKGVDGLPTWSNGKPKWGFLRVPATGPVLVERDEAEARIEQAALTRQPVAGDGVVLVPRESLKASLHYLGENCHLDHHGYCQEHGLQPGEECFVKMFRDALIATPADGGEGK